MSPAICRNCPGEPAFYIDSHMGGIYWIRFEFKNYDGQIVVYDMRNKKIRLYPIDISLTLGDTKIIQCEQSLPLKDVLNKVQRLLKLKAFL